MAKRNSIEGGFKISGLITQGYGPKNLIITQGFGVWGKVEEVITEVISRVYPLYRKGFRISFPLKGDLVRPFHSEVEIFGDLVVKFHKLIPLRGKKDLREILALIFSEEPSEDEETLSELELKIKMLEKADKILEKKAKAAETIAEEELQRLTEAEKIQRASELMEELSKADKAKDAKGRQKSVEKLYRLVGV